MKDILLSVVVANYNYGRFLEETLLSLFQQSVQDFEVIVVDGGSTDNSVEVIKKYEDRIAWWVSEKDGGQSNAFNKGFSHARGRFLTWLNADDVMMPGTMKAFSEAVVEHPECSWFVGGVMWLSPEMKIIKMGRGRPFSRMRAAAGDINVWGPSSMFSRELYNDVGGIDERFKYAMDSDLWRRFYYKCGVRYLPFANYAWGLRLHPEAKMSGHNFSADGTFHAGTAESLLSKDSGKFKQLALESAWLREVYAPQHRLTRARQLMSMSIFQSFMARVDTYRYKGKYYMEYYK